MAGGGSLSSLDGRSAPVVAPCHPGSAGREGRGERAKRVGLDPGGPGRAPSVARFGGGARGRGGRIGRGSLCRGRRRRVGGSIPLRRVPAPAVDGGPRGPP